MATNNTTKDVEQPPTEESPLNVEKIAPKLEIGAQEESKDDDELSETEQIKEKVKKPAIGISLIIFLTLNIVMFVVGLTTIKDCPIKPIIPIYLVVAGALGVVTKIIPIANRNKRIVIVDRILYGLFLIEFIWMILGSVWIYSIYEPNFNPHFGEYCNKTAYLLAFWLLTLHYICLLLMITIPCIVIAFCCFVASKALSG